MAVSLPPDFSTTLEDNFDLQIRSAQNFMSFVEKFESAFKP